MDNEVEFLEKYQDWVGTTATQRVKELGFIYPALGLAGETGEVVEKVKKIVRDKDGYWNTEDREYFKLELGDILWYITRMCTCLGLELEQVFKANIEKIDDRRINGKK